MGGGQLDKMQKWGHSLIALAIEQITFLMTYLKEMYQVRHETLIRLKEMRQGPQYRSAKLGEANKMWRVYVYVSSAPFPRGAIFIYLYTLSLSHEADLKIGSFTTHIIQIPLSPSAERGATWLSMHEINTVRSKIWKYMEIIPHPVSLFLQMVS